MTDAVVQKYAKLLDEFDFKDEFSTKERTGLEAFLKRQDITPESLANLVADFRSRAESTGYMTKETDRWIIYIDGFEQFGTINTRPHERESCTNDRELRRQLALTRLKTPYA